MRTNFIPALAAAALLTVSSAAVALAQAADVNATMNADVIADQASSIPTQNTTPNVGWSAHHHPHGIRQR
jgi:hypothetical protein